MWKLNGVRRRVLTPRQVRILLTTAIPRALTPCSLDPSSLSFWHLSLLGLPTRKQPHIFNPDPLRLYNMGELS